MLEEVSSEVNHASLPFSNYMNSLLIWIMHYDKVEFKSLKSPFNRLVFWLTIFLIVARTLVKHTNTILIFINTDTDIYNYIKKKFRFRHVSAVLCQVSILRSITFLPIASRKLGYLRLCNPLISLTITILYVTSGIQ